MFCRLILHDCGHDYFVAYSCNARADHVSSRLPMRQWVLSVPNRLHYFMQRDKAVLNMVHRRSGIVYMTPQSAHYGHAQVLRAIRKAALDAAFLAHPNRFKGKSPRPHELPKAAWINPPKKETNIPKEPQPCAVNL